MKEIPVAGIDVGKAFSDMCVLAPNNTLHSKIKILHDLPSLEQSLLVLKDTEEIWFQTRDNHEATAHDHRLITHFMQQAGYEVVVINPLQSGALKNINIREIERSFLCPSNRSAVQAKAINPTSMPRDVIRQ